MSCGSWCNDTSTDSVVEPVPQTHSHADRHPAGDYRRTLTPKVEETIPAPAPTAVHTESLTGHRVSAEPPKPMDIHVLKEEVHVPPVTATAPRVSVGKELMEGERLILCKRAVQDNVTPVSLNKRKGGKPNILRTAQFTMLTWLPLSLFHQFKRLANIYFLFIACIVLWGSFGPQHFSPKDWKSKLGPFTLVLLWSALKDLYEDVRRKRDDKKENEQTVKRYNHATERFEDTFWCDVLVGDLCLIPCDRAFPADLVLMNCGQETTAFISTVQLDGETALKERSVPKVFTDVADGIKPNGVKEAWPEDQAEALNFASRLFSPGCEVKMGIPDAVLSDVRGTVTMDTSVTPLGEANFLPRGCVLRNTPFAVALSVYVGQDTKARLNAIKAVYKFSNMQRTLNLLIRGLLVFIFSVCLYAMIMSQLHVFGHEDAPFNWFLMYLRFCIAFYHAVPMSLYVAYEMLKLVLGFQVNLDAQMMYDGEGATARTCDLLEELGQVDFIFSDKTGTLTANEMVFARAHIDGQDVGDFRNLEGKPGPPEGLVATKNILAKKDHKSEHFAWFYTCLATCHEVVIELTTKEKAASGAGITYTGMSPDEVALVNAARDVGLVFERRNRLPGGINELEIRDHTGKLRKYEVPLLIQFTSDRKRMSVIIKSEGKAWVICKGADSHMEPLCHGGFSAPVKDDILKFSRTGLRVLVVASRELEHHWLEDWIMDYQKARGIFDASKEEKLREVVARLETNLTVAGLTAVEDRLQDGVPEAIKTVKEAGSRVWVLTGDKTETAVNIAYSCALFTEHTRLAYVTGMTTIEEAIVGLKAAQKSLQGANDAGIVLDGSTLLLVINDDQCRALIFELGMASQSCICTRMSPMQKLQVVQLVRKADKNRITLTIGDGANDVPMILGGHVGIGIRGKEGAAAVQVCDVAISQFRFLVPLMLCHGRRAYRRVAIFLLYYLYKNLVLLMADLVWMHWDNFKGHVAFPEWLSIAYNAFFTSWHAIIILGWDKDVTDKVAVSHPELYKVGPQRRLFNPKTFFKWVCYAIYHGVAAWLVPFFILQGQEYGSVQFWTSSTCAFTNVVHITLLKMIIFSENPFHWITLVPSLCSWIMFVCYLIGLSYSPLGNTLQPQVHGIAEKIITYKNAPLTLFLGPVIALTFDVVERLVMRYVFPSALQKVEFASKQP